MNIVNVMWAGGSPYTSVHKVHRQILSHAGPQASVSNWLLLGTGTCCSVGSIREWHMPSRALKGRHLWRFMLPWLRLRVRKELQASAADVLLLDGLGVARLVLPVLRDLHHVHASVLFHGSTRLRDSDIRLLRSLPAERLNIVAVSNTLAFTLEQTLGRPVHTLRVALEPQWFVEHLLSREQARCELALQDDQRPIFGAVGRLVESKGFEMLIEAFGKVHGQDKRARLVILGEGNHRDRLEARIKALGLGDTVQLCGYRDDLSRLYRAFDWLLVPSRSEGLGLVLQEAVMAGVPVISSDLPVFREQLKEAGCYLPVAQGEAWSKAIEGCALRSAPAVAAEQYRVLAPEQAWRAFQQRAQDLLR
ncbi:glycosyltransferase [Pseudomonas cremoricolorata]|uniref:glycosyltransferase n=1 Tax=Pseudomonas cremoricolorata TaxID=157783 RepID=UPI000406D58C|nr:glycosyltransferase [Pseudomonas cremoricolorata]